MRFNGIRKKTFDFRQRHRLGHTSALLESHKVLAPCPVCGLVGLVSTQENTYYHVVSAWKDAKTGRPMGFEILQECKGAE